MYDYIIVGAGLYGSIYANIMTKRGFNCLVIDKRNHIGGNLYTEKIENINVHMYGAHIFHTNNENVWNFINSHIKMKNYCMQPIAINNSKVYNLPFNMNTFSKVFDVSTPAEARAKIYEEIMKCNLSDISNLEEKAISNVGTTIYKLLIKDYVEKQWGRDCRDLPSFIIERLPLRFTYDNNYFYDNYQAIPVDGYNTLFDSLLNGIDVKLNFDFFENRDWIEKNAKKIVYTGMIDQFFDYKFGKLEYRSLEFEFETLNVDNYQGNSMVSYTSHEVPYTRIIEHKHFENSDSSKTIITKEYSKMYNGKNEPFYPINTKNNQEIFFKYQELSKESKQYIFGGRLAEYKYYDMDKVIAKALTDLGEL